MAKSARFSDVPASGSPTLICYERLAPTEREQTLLTLAHDHMLALVDAFYSAWSSGAATDSIQRPPRTAVSLSVLHDPLPRPRTGPRRPRPARVSPHGHRLLALWRLPRLQPLLPASFRSFGPDSAGTSRSLGRSPPSSTSSALPTPTNFLRSPSH